MQIEKPKHIWQLSFEGDWPTSVTFLGDNQLAAGNRGGQIYLWKLPDSPDKGEVEGKEDPPDHQPSRRFDGHSNAISHLLAGGDEETLISSSFDRTIRLWNVQSPATGSDEVVLDSKRRERFARSKPRKERDAIINAAGIEVETCNQAAVLEGHKDWIRAQSINADGSRLLSGDDSCLSIVWDLPARKQICSWRGYPRVWVSSAALSPDGKTAFTAEFAGSRSSFDRPAAQARLWNADDGSPKLDLLKVWTPKVKDNDRVDSYGYAKTWGKLMKRGLVCAACSPDGKLLAVGQGGETDTGKVHLVDVASGEILRTVSGHRYGVCDVTFSADSRYVLSTGRDTTLRICQVSDGKEVAALGKSRGGQFKDWFHAVAVSPNQELVAAADIAGLVHVWRLVSSQPGISL